jgi:hypothetical protein
MENEKAIYYAKLSDYIELCEIDFCKRCKGNWVSCKCDICKNCGFKEIFSCFCCKHCKNIKCTYYDLPLN